MVSSQVIEELQHDDSLPALALKRLIKNSVNPLWRQQHSEKWRSTDLIVIKQNATAERLAGFIKDNSFYIAYVFRNHESYERDLPKYNIAAANALTYKEWQITNNVGSETQGDNSLIKERDELLAKNIKNENSLSSLRDLLELAELEIQEQAGITLGLKARVAELEKEKLQTQAQYSALEKNNTVLQETLKNIQQQTFWQRVLFVFKASN